MPQAKSRVEALYVDDLAGLARQCPKCGLIAHYEVKTRKPVKIKCVECDFEFTVQKYKKGERPGCHYSRFRK